MWHFESTSGHCNYAKHMQSLAIYQFLIDIYLEESQLIWGYHCQKVNILTWKCGLFSLLTAPRSDVSAGLDSSTIYGPGPCLPHMWEIKTFTYHWSSSAGVAQLVGASSHALKGHRFNSRSGHMPGLQIWPPVGVRVGSNWLVVVSLSSISMYK